MKIEIPLGYLFNQDLSGLNPALVSFITMGPRHSGLKYDIEIRLSKAIDQELKNFDESRTSLCESFAEETEYINAEGKTIKTKFIVKTDADGKQSEEKGYNIPEDKKEEFNKRFIELLENKVELNCNKIKLSKLENENDVSSQNFRYLEPFIQDDMN